MGVGGMRSSRCRARLSAGLLALGERPLAAEELDPEPATGAGAGRLRRPAAVAAALGFLAMASQVCWLRLFGMVTGSSVYSMSMVLAVCCRCPGATA